MRRQLAPMPHRLRRHGRSGGADGLHGGPTRPRAARSEGNGCSRQSWCRAGRVRSPGHRPSRAGGWTSGSVVSAPTTGDIAGHGADRGPDRRVDIGCENLRFEPFRAGQDPAVFRPAGRRQGRTGRARPAQPAADRPAVCGVRPPAPRDPRTGRARRKGDGFPYSSICMPCFGCRSWPRRRENRRVDQDQRRPAFAERPGLQQRRNPGHGMKYSGGRPRRRRAVRIACRTASKSSRNWLQLWFSVPSGGFCPWLRVSNRITS